MFINLTFELTESFAAEAIAAAGGSGTADELEMVIRNSRIKYQVRGNNVANFIQSQAQHGYRVIDAAASAKTPATHAA